MACPFFYATQKVSGARQCAPVQMPLGDTYEGECRAHPDPYRPAEEELARLCNLGYARTKCPRFPPEAGPDAVRFAVSRDNQEKFVVLYVEERDHLPWEHGSLEYDVGSQKFVEPHPNPIVNRLAEAYAEAYLRRIARSLIAPS